MCYLSTDWMAMCGGEAVALQPGRLVYCLCYFPLAGFAVLAYSPFQIQDDKNTRINAT